MRKMKNKKTWLISKTISQINLGLLAKIINIGTVSEVKGKVVEKLSERNCPETFLSPVAQPGATNHLALFWTQQACLMDFIGCSFSVQDCNDLFQWMI